MIGECARCGFEIDTDSEAGQQQGVTRAWRPPAGDQPGYYADMHPLCRAQERQEQTQPAKRGPGRPRKALSEPVLATIADDDEM